MLSRLVAINENILDVLVRTYTYNSRVLMNSFIRCRHEVPIAADPISIIHMDEDIVVVNKPASIPVSGIEDCQCTVFFVVVR